MIAVVLAVVGLLTPTDSTGAIPPPPPQVILAGEIDLAFRSDPDICLNYVGWMDQLHYSGLLDMPPGEASDEFYFSWPNALYAWEVEWFELSTGYQRTLSRAGHDALLANLDQCLRDTGWTVP